MPVQLIEVIAETTLVLLLFSTGMVQSRRDDADKVVCCVGFRAKVQVGQVSHTLYVARVFVDYNGGDA